MKRENEQSLSEIMQDLIKAYKLQPKLNEVKLKQAWDSLMGDTIVSYTRQLYLAEGRLFVHLESAPLRQELLFGKDKIRELLNSFIGEDLIKEVVIR